MHTFFEIDFLNIMNRQVIYQLLLLQAVLIIFAAFVFVLFCFFFAFFMRGGSVRFSFSYLFYKNLSDKYGFGDSDSNDFSWCYGGNKSSDSFSDFFEGIKNTPLLKALKIISPPLREANWSLSFSFFLLAFLGLVLVTNSLIFFAYWYCSTEGISILNMPFLTASPKLLIVLKFAKLYLVLYPLESIFVLPVFYSFFLIFPSSFMVLRFSVCSKTKCFYWWQFSNLLVSHTNQ